ncbi:MAG: glycogen synthase, partial [Chlamydiae bacterium]|nr:glycogen synthase [Chlamydiota bacterium]
EDFWNPETDPFLQKNYPSRHPFSQEAWSLVQQGKKENKKQLQKQLGLKESSVPLVACVTRLVPQKGPLLIAHAFRHVLDRGAQCVILGSLFSDDMRELFTFLQSEYLASSQGALLFDYNEPLAHLIYAAADILLVPSLFEPCGLSQMIALRYGCLPIVRKTGGLGDTIFDEDNGFVFTKACKDELNQTIDRALALFAKEPSSWQKIMQQGMAKDMSWRLAAKEYERLYLV